MEYLAMFKLEPFQSSQEPALYSSSGSGAAGVNHNESMEPEEVCQSRFHAFATEYGAARV